MHECNTGNKPSGQQQNSLRDEVVKSIKYKKSTIDNAIYTKVFSDGTVSYRAVYTDDVLNNTNNEESFPELTRVFEEAFGIKVQEGSVLK